MNELLKRKLIKINKGIVTNELIEFVENAIANGLPDLKAEIKADKEATLVKLEAAKAKLKAEIVELNK